jgi:outer membrane protein OmpA-like peptidoglycan-associated protein
MRTRFTFTLLLLPAIVFGQLDNAALIAEGNKNFGLEQYHLAIEYYLKVKDKNEGIFFRLAESYRNTFNYGQAELFYLQSLDIDPKQPLALYHYGLMLKLNSKYQESIQQFSSFIDRYSDDSSLKEYIEQAAVDRAGSEAALNEASNPENKYSLTDEPFNSIYNDYAPVWIDSNRVIITSGRVHSTRDVIDERYGEAFADNYLFERHDGSWEDITRKEMRNLNSRFNDGSGSFNQRSGKYYFTVCGKESSECRIFLSNHKAGKWSDPVPLNGNVNTKKFESKHPAISPGGDTLLFASNRPGGQGQFDVWMSVNSGNDDWGPAINLGNSINTKFNDLAPSFSEFNHIFFFASEGHQGFGGMDLYMAKRFSNGSSAIYNIGFPFNSNRDDCFVSLSGKTLSISSNREGKGGFDIYSSPIISPLSFVSRLSLKNRSGRNDIGLMMAGRESTWMDIYASRNEDRIDYEHLPNEKKLIVDRMLQKRSTGQANKREEFSQLSAGEYEQLLGIAQTQYTELELRRKFNGTLIAAIRPPADCRTFGIHAVVADSVSGQPLGGLTVFLMNSKGEVLKATTTNEAGTFRFTNVESPEQLYIRYEGQVGHKARPIVKDLLVLRDKSGSFAFENVYFDTDQFELRDDAKETLSRLAKFLLSLPDVQVEIFAYADDRGQDQYNLVLSEKRGQSVRKHLGLLGVDPTSVAVVPKGRQFDAKASNLDEHRQFNRRVEFYVNGASKESFAANGNKSTP